MANQRNLVRTLGLSYVIIFVVANIIGSGVYKKIAPMATELHSSVWILLAWIVAGIITIFGALCNAEVAGLLADTGGEFVYLKKIYNRFFAFLYGWSLFTVIQTATISSLAYVFAQSLNNIIPIPEIFPSLQHLTIGGVFYPFQDFGIKLTAILLILLLTNLNISGLKSGVWVSKAILGLVFIGIFIIVIFGLTSNVVKPVNFMHVSDLTSGAVTFSSFFTAMLAAFWAYQGWVSVGFIGGEVKDATRNIPKGIVIGVFIVIIIYLLVNVTYLSLLSIPQLEQIHSSGNQIAAVEAVRSFWGTGGVMFISLLILLTTLGCTNASILTGARPYYAMARDRLFFPGIGKLNKTNVPGNSLLWQGLWASVLVLSGSFDQLTDMLIFAVFIFYGATSLGVFILRRRMSDAYRPYKVWGYPFVPAIFIIFCICLVFNTIITRPREAAIGIILILSGIPVYYLLQIKYSYETLSQELLTLQKQLVLDKRVAILEIELKDTLQPIITISGVTDLPDAKAKIIQFLTDKKVSFIDSLRLLPDSSVGDKMWALATLSVSNIRALPDDASELVSQAMMGTPLKVLDYNNKWYRVQTPEKYIGWMDSSGLQQLTAIEMEYWRNADRYLYHNLSGYACDAPTLKGDIITDLVLGDLFEVESADKGFFKIKIPDGRTGYVKKVDCISFDDWSNSEPNFKSLVPVARQMMGSPYLWGGASSKAVDCSGFVKLVYYAQGIILARDASQQARFGEPIDFNNMNNLQPGDLLFFGSSAQRISHVGIYLEKGNFIHSSGRVHISSIDPGDPKYVVDRKNQAACRILNSLNTEGIVRVKDHPWYNDKP